MIQSCWSRGLDSRGVRDKNSPLAARQAATPGAKVGCVLDGPK